MLPFLCKRSRLWLQLILSGTMSRRECSLSSSPPPPTTHQMVQFAGDAIETTVTTDAAAASNWVQSLLSEHRPPIDFVGLDCEWRPNYVKNKGNKVATLQLCVGNKCLVLQLSYMERVPQSIVNFLDDENITFVGVDINDDIKKLGLDYGLRCRRSADLVMPCRYFLRLDRSGQSLGLSGYAREVLGLSMEKPKNVTMSNWQERTLFAAQARYACIDAYVSYKLGCKVLPAWISSEGEKWKEEEREKRKEEEREKRKRRKNEKERKNKDRKAKKIRKNKD